MNNQISDEELSSVTGGVQVGQQKSVYNIVWKNREPLINVINAITPQMVADVGQDTVNAAITDLCKYVMNPDRETLYGPSFLRLGYHCYEAGGGWVVLPGGTKPF